MIPRFRILVAGTAVSLAVSAGAADLRDRIAVWGYVLDNVPTACPFVLGKTEFSLERAAAEFGVRRAMYMNSCFNRDYIVKEFPDWDRECFANCIDNRLCDVQLEKLRGMDEVWCATTHGKKLESAVRIAEMSLRFPNIVGVNFDDFNNGNPATKMSVAELRELKARMHAVNPKLKVSVVSYVKDANETDFDLTPFRGEIDHVSRWKWVTETNYWTKANFRADIAELRRQVGPGVTVVQGLYLHDFASDMKCPNPLPFDYFKLSVTTALDAVADGTLDGVILPQVAWYSAPTHRRHYEWLREKIRAFLGGVNGQDARSPEGTCRANGQDARSPEGTCRVNGQDARSPEGACRANGQDARSPVGCIIRRTGVSPVQSLKEKVK